MGYNDGLASLAFRAKWARGLLWAFMAISLTGIPLGLAAGYVLRWGVPVFYFDIVLLSYIGISILNLAGLVVSIPLWVHRAWKNLHLLGLRGLRRSPGWAAGSFFVPLAGLVVPFLAMRELYNRSIGEDEDQASASASDVTSWWTCYVAGALLQGFVVMTAFFNTNGVVFIVTPLIMSYALAIFGNVLMVGAAWFLIRTIREITAAQSSSAGVSETFA